MKLGFSDADEAFRQELLAFLDEHTPAEVAGGRDWIGDDHDTDPDGIMVIPGGPASGRRPCSTTAG